ncbi:hypothetical protein F4818DRAFT_412116 [Hypoxylon cercidicola]|nr:hypothetical protein F4818DRAFT_412116 [Hypoxylon cercidicola]
MLVDLLSRHLRLERWTSTSSPTRRDSEEDEYIEEDEEFEQYEEPCRPPAYPYHPLNETEIRLLRIVPGTDTIECALHQMPLAEVRYFYALSYVWGDTRHQKTIMLEGKPFHITNNLYEALHQFRQQPFDIGHPKDYFWVDAICINQNDMEEKSCQIPRMVDIYHAGHVAIWLGHVKELPADSLFKKFMRRANSTPPKISRDQATKTLFKKADSMWMDWEPIDEDDNVVLHSEFGQDYEVIIQVVANILNRPWFNRVWTIQEASSLDTYPRLYVGRHSVYLKKFIELWKLLAMEHRPLFLCPGSARMVSLGRIDALHRSALFDGEGNPKKMDMAEVLLTLLKIAGKKECTDPRDQIYGLLGLLKDLGEGDLPEELMPDYHLPYEEVYWRCAALLFESVGDLRLLDCGRNEIGGDVPSWIPDFRHLSHMPVIRRGESVRVSSDKRVLHVRGCVLGTFRDFITGCASTHIWPKFKAIPIALPIRLREFEEHILEPSASIRGMTIEEAFDDMISGLTRLIPEQGPETFYQVHRRLSNSFGGKRSWFDRRKRTTNIRLKEEAIADQLSSPFLLLDDGSIVVVKREDAEVRPGDLVCIFKGASELSLVRASGKSYTFLGQCEVKSGPLKGEKFEDDFWADRDVEDFELI